MGYLAGEGMSNRAIASVVAADEKTVRNDLKVGAEMSAPTVVADLREAGQIDPPDMAVNRVTGEVVTHQPPTPAVSREPLTVVRADRAQPDPDRQTSPTCDDTPVRQFVEPLRGSDRTRTPGHTTSTRLPGFHQQC